MAVYGLMHTLTKTDYFKICRNNVKLSLLNLAVIYKLAVQTVNNSLQLGYMSFISQKC